MEGDYLWDSTFNGIVFPCLMSGSYTAVLSPVSGAAAVTCPQYSGSTIVGAFEVGIPYDGVVTAKASYQGTGVITRATV